MKKILILGASYLQQFIIKKAKELGCYTIALDANKDSEGFNYADKYYVCSTDDKEGVFEIAVKENVDAVLTYASDVAALTVAYVAEKLGLPTNPYSSVQILTNKKKTRDFLQKNGFNVPRNMEVGNEEDAVKAAQEIGFPVIFKPTDASGSKGVSKVEKLEDVERAFEFALTYSREKKIMVEEFIERSGYQVDADAFMYDGELIYFDPMDQHQDVIAPYCPIGISAPSVLPNEKAEFVFNEVKRLLGLLNMQFGAFNIEYVFNKSGELYIYEVAPRSGGNLIPDVIYAGTGFDIQKCIVLASLNQKVDVKTPILYHRNVTSFVIHSQEDGLFEGIDYSPEVKNGLLLEKISVKKGDRINKFKGGAYGLGYCLIEFDDADFMRRVMDNSAAYIKIRLQK